MATDEEQAVIYAAVALIDRARLLRRGDRLHPMVLAQLQRAVYAYRQPRPQAPPPQQVTCTIVGYAPPDAAKEPLD